MAKQFWFLAGLALLLAACGGQTGGGSGGGGGGGGGSSPSFTLSLDPTSLTVQQGSSGTTALTLTPQNGFTGTVSLSLAAGQDPVPQGLNLSPQSVQVSGANPVNQPLTLSVSSSTPTGTYRLKVRGTSGSLIKEADLTVTVAPSSGDGGSGSGSVTTPGGQVQVTVQGGTFLQGPTYQNVPPPPGFQAPYGAIAFTVRVAQGGTSTAVGALGGVHVAMTFTVRIVFPSRPPQEATLQLYQDNTWKAIPGVQFSENTATYSVEDGGPLDADGRQDGQVVNTVALLVPATSPAPATWMRTYGTPESDRPADAIPTADGGYLIAAYWYNVGSGAPGKPHLLKINAEGHLEWSKFADTDFSPANVVSAPDGGYLIAGYADYTSVFLLKVDGRGNPVWQKRYGLPQTREVRDLFLFPTPDGGYALFGTVTVDRAEGSWNWNTWLMKLDAQGNLLWQKGLAREGFETDLTAVKAVRDGYILAGTNRSWSLTSYHLTVVKLDPDGQILWKRMFSEPPSDCGVGEDIEATPDGGYVILGSCWVPDSQRVLREDVFVMRLDGEGNLLWSRRYGGESDDRGYDLLVTPDGGYLVVGRTEIAPGGAWLLKLDPQGNVEWERTYRGSNTAIRRLMDMFRSIFAVDGGYVIVGYTEKLSSWVGNEYNAGDIWVLKVDAQGRVANCDASVVQGNGGSWVREVPLQALDPNDPTYHRWIPFDPGFAPQPVSINLQEGFMSERGTQCGR